MVLVDFFNCVIFLGFRVGRIRNFIFYAVSMEVSKIVVVFFYFSSFFVVVIKGVAGSVLEFFRGFRFRFGV